MKSEGFLALALTLVMVQPHAAWSQVIPQQPRTPAQGRAGQPAVAPAQLSQLAEPLRPNYVLGVGDVIQIRGLGEEIGWP